MMKQWLTRRSVRRPFSRRTTAPISSSVCRLPFISASALPCSTSSTALSAAAWLCGASTIGQAEMSMWAARAASRMRCAGPTRMGSINPSRAAPMAPSMDAASQGWTMAVTVGRRPWQASSSCWYLEWLLIGADRVAPDTMIPQRGVTALTPRSP
jgi:hypothetical protein